jgi:predicted aldo/keto reductase-like oxidoreductase
MDGMARYKYSQIEVNASACEACGKCDGICPEGLNIPEMLKQAQASFD